VFTEDFWYGLPDTRHDHVVQIDEAPFQVAGKRGAYSGLAGSHEADKKNGPGRARTILQTRFVCAYQF
jgi:hypothetical protein